MGTLRKVSGFMIAAAILVAVPAIWEIGPSGSACPGALGAAEICMWPDQYGQMYAATLRAEPFDGQDGPVLLVGILSASAAILAITFTLNQIVMSNVSQRYSFRLVESASKKPTEAFEAFVYMVAGSAALLLAYDSLPAWLATCLVLGVTAGFFAALWKFARGFVHLTKVVHPPEFIGYVKNQILTDVKSTGEDKASVQSMNEQSKNAIQPLGDVFVQFLTVGDTSTCDICIDALYEIGEALLHREKTRPTNKTGKKRFQIPPRDPPLDHVFQEFEKVLRKSADAQESKVTCRALDKFCEMTKLAMQDENNKPILETLHDTHDHKGTFWWRFVDKLTDVGTKTNKNCLVRHLVDLTAAATQSGHMKFVEEFVTYHVFRSVKTIIDKNDFELFKKVIDLFSYSGNFVCKEDMHRFVQSQISRGHSRLRDPDALALYDKIAFELNNSAKRNFGKILELKQDAKLFLAQTQSNEASETAQNNTERTTLRYMDRLYACSLLWGTFFRLACHIIGKGDEYGAYLYELWHHTNPPGQPYRSANAPPCSKDVDWNSLYPGWAGRGDSDYLELIDEPITYKPHYYKYAVLHMLRDDKIWNVPGDSKIDRWGKNDSLYKLEHYYDIVRNIETERFLEALDSLAGSKLPAEMLPGIDIQARIESIKKKLESFKDRQKIIAKMLAAQMAVDGAKIQKWENKVREAYSESTKADAVARIKYDVQLDRTDAFVIRSLSLPRHALVRKGDVLLPEDLGSQSAAAEFEEILSKAEDGAVPVKDTGNPLDAIKAGVRKMRDGGYKPRAVILSQGDEDGIWHTDPVAISGGDIDADGSPVQIVEAPEFVQPETTLIIDPDCIEITYKAEDRDGRLQLDVPDQDKAEVTMTSTIPMSVTILDVGGVAKIAPADA